jgi:hypothetical protein
MTETEKKARNKARRIFDYKEQIEHKGNVFVARVF